MITFQLKFCFEKKDIIRFVFFFKNTVVDEMQLRNS